MRINVYAEEITDRVELVQKSVDGQTFYGLRFYLGLPVTCPRGGQISGPFMHRPEDDDSSAVTFWATDIVVLNNLAYFAFMASLVA